MKTLPLSEAKDRLSRIIGDVANRDERVMITRNGRPAAIVVSPEEFESWQATIDILSDPALVNGQLSMANEKSAPVAT